MNKFSIKTTLFVLVLLAVLLRILLSGDIPQSVADGDNEAGSADLVSAIQPVSDVSADAGAVLHVAHISSGPISSGNRELAINSLSDDDLVSLTRRFDEANAAVDQGDSQAGLKGLEELILDYPSIIEPYLNVASIYAEQQDLEKAREILLSGFSANPKAGMLFDHLKKVHGALAANSYRKALDTNSATSVKLVLARASSILTQLDQSNQVAALKKELQENQNQTYESANQLQAKTVAALESKLQNLEATAAMDKSVYELELRDLKKQIDDHSLALIQSQTAERDALARVVRAEQDALNQISEITEQLESQKAVLVTMRALSSEQAITLAKSQLQAQELAVLEAENSRLAEENEKMAQAAIADKTVMSSSDLMQKNRHQNAVGLVQSWAKAWSEQDVSAYVGHYGENYSSSRSLSRKQWLEQRQVRLTNKEFISVDVSNFEVEDMGSQFSVTFSQYYQSNTVDDRVAKRLLFNKSGDDWSQSKILKEELVSGFPER
jgi:hypothetical protein